MQAGAVAERQHKLAVDIQHTGGFYAVILYFGIGIGKIRDLFSRDPLNVYHKYAFVRKNELIPDGLKRLYNLLTGHKEPKYLRPNRSGRNFFQIHQFRIEKDPTGNVCHEKHLLK